MSGFISLVAFNFLFYGNTLRHFGFVFIYLIACLWISENRNKEEGYLINFGKLRNKKFLSIFLIIILSLSVAGSSIASFYDYKYPFSSGKQVAEYIEKNFDKDNIVMVGYKDADVQTIMAYMDKEMYLPQKRDFGLFITNRIRLNDVETEEIFKQAFSLISESDLILTIIHCRAINDPGIPERYLFEKIDVIFDAPIVKYENFCLYQFKKSDHTSIFSLNDLDFAEYQNMEVLMDSRDILIEEAEEELKFIKAPIKLEPNSDYLISFKIKSDYGLSGNLNIDLYGKDYDYPEQEFSLSEGEITGRYNGIARIINSGDVPDNEEVYLRIYTYAEGQAVIKNLEVYKIKYTD
jgi:hypothetical protein